MSTQFFLWYTVCKNGREYIILGLIQGRRSVSPLAHRVTYVCEYESVLTVGMPPPEVEKQVTNRRKGGRRTKRNVWVGEGGESDRCYVPQLHNSTEAMRAAVFSDRGLIVYLKGAGWL